jgi:hypothetical protein
MNSLHRVPALLTLLALGALGLLVGSAARAEDGAAARQGSATSVYDVRVVRVDPVESTVLEVAPPWQPVVAVGATTSVAWADLLAGLKRRGRTTILLDQRVTAIGGVPAEFKQERKCAVLMLSDRTVQDTAAKTETWRSMYNATGTSGQLVTTPDGLQYRVEVLWDERPTADGTAPMGNTSWKGSYSNLKAGETLVLSHRQQQVAGTEPIQSIEIYVLVTGWPVSAK